MVRPEKENIDERHCPFINIENNSVNLCDSCTHNIETCPGNGILYGDGKGNDNIVCCAAYTPGFKKVKK